MESLERATFFATLVSGILAFCEMTERIFLSLMSKIISLVFLFSRHFMLG